MKHEPPAEQDTVDLIAPAFDRLPAPDSRRLAAIEQLLSARAHPRRRAIVWWWLAAVLTAGAASALWWDVDYDSGKEPEAPVPAVMPLSVAPSVASPPARPRQSEGKESKPAGASAPKQGPVIYQQER